MRRIIFRKEAEADLRNVIAYYEAVAPDSLPTILNDIYRSVDQLVHFPHLRMQVEGRSYRRIVTLKISFQDSL